MWPFFQDVHLSLETSSCKGVVAQTHLIVITFNQHFMQRFLEAFNPQYQNTNYLLHSFL